MFRLRLVSFSPIVYSYHSHIIILPIFLKENQVQRCMHSVELLEGRGEGQRIRGIFRYAT